MQSLTAAVKPGPSPVGYAPFRDERAGYETHGTSLVRYLARRTAKTRLLLPLGELLAEDRAGSSAEALALVGQYVLAAATSFGRGYRQPSFDATGTTITEHDPETEAVITARLDGRGPGSRIRLSVVAEVAGIGRFGAAEEITGTTVGLHGLGMPAPSRFVFESLDPLRPWTARATGIVTTELGPSLGGFVVRGHADLELSADDGSRGTARLSRDGTARIAVSSPDGTRIDRTVRIA